MKIKPNNSGAVTFAPVDLDALQKRFEAEIFRADIEEGLDPVPAEIKARAAMRLRTWLEEKRAAIEAILADQAPPCTCGSDPGQPASAHDISCPAALDDEAQP